MKGVLLTGLPGVGKSTACKKVAELCAAQGVRVEGFLTEELRQRGSRVGFDLVELGEGQGRRAPLARIGQDDGPRVGRYTVNLKEFEALALPVMERISKVPAGEKVVCIVDEIGKMELFSKEFVSRVRYMLNNRPVPMLFTIALHGGGFIAEAKRVKGLELIEITQDSRDAAPADIIARLLGGAPDLGDLSGSTPSPPKQVPDAATQGNVRVSRWRARAEPGAKSDGASNAEVEHSTAASSADGGTHGQPQTTAKRQASGRVTAGAAGGRVVLWLRNELRLADNPLLMHAVECAKDRNSALIPAFCFDPRDFSSQSCTSWKSLKVGHARRRFLEESVADLESGFQNAGSRLLVFDSPPEEALAKLVGNGDLVIACAEFCPEEQAAEQRVKEAVHAVGASLHLVDSGGITTIFGIEDLQSLSLEGGSKFPEDFNVFYRAVRDSVATICKAGLSNSPTELPSSVQRISSMPGLRKPGQVSANGLGSEPQRHEPQLKFHGGEGAGSERMHKWLHNGGLRTYKATFRNLLGDYSSRLSPHLVFGCLSAHRLVTEALSSVQFGPHVDHFIYELCWRDFFRHAAKRWGSTLFKRNGPLGPSRGAGTDRAWTRDAAAEVRWRAGSTGVPLVDAAMRELLATGYLGNLARQITASYLIEELGLDWRIGADWFESNLVDYDPHSNWGQWARSAGVVPTTDAKRQRVGGTRYFDIAFQVRSREAAAYVRKWIPELKELDDNQVFAPWLLGKQMGEYPMDPLCGPELQRYFEVATMGGGKGGKGGKQSSKQGGKGGKGRR